MTEVNTGMHDLPEACSLRSCDLRCPSPPPCCAPSTNQEEAEEGGCHDNRKPEQQKQCHQTQPKKKMKPKARLVRSMAVCEEPVLIPGDSHQDSKDAVETDVWPGCHGDEKPSYKEEEQDKIHEPKKPSLSKEPSLEYTDSTGIDLQQFIIDTLNSNPRDRMMLLKLEQDMIDFLNSNSPFKKFPHMSSYHRMLVHRVAAYFGMEHNVDQTGKAVIINRTSNTRIPEQRFLDEIHEEKPEEIQRWKAILKRDNSADEQPRPHPLRERQSKSMEERAEEYQKARDRIFNQETGSSQDSFHAETRKMEDCNTNAEAQRKRRLFGGSRDGSGSSRTGSSRQSSTETEYRYGNDPQPWSSTDSDSSFQWTSPAPKPRQAANWDTRGSGSIALYRVPSSCPHAPSPLIPEEPGPATNPTYIIENGIPPGSILMNPHTGQPFLNPDGTPAVYNPPDSLQPIRSQPPPPVPPAQQQQQQVVQYTSAPYPPPQMLTVAPSQPTAAQVEELSTQFGHVTVSCQSSGEGPPLYPANQAYVYTAPPPPNPSGHCQPPPQMPMYYYSGAYATSAQPCRSLSPNQHSHSQVAQSAGCPSSLMVHASQNQGQPMLGSYQPVSSHQCGLVQGGVPVPYPQGAAIMPAVGGDGAYCCLLAPPPCGQPTMAPRPPPPTASLHGTCASAGCANLGPQAWAVQY